MCTVDLVVAILAFNVDILILYCFDNNIPLGVFVDGRVYCNVITELMLRSRMCLTPRRSRHCKTAEISKTIFQPWLALSMQVHFSAVWLSIF